MSKIDNMELLVKTLEFWTGFYFKDEKDCYDWAVEKAYPDMARHTLKYNKNVQNRDDMISNFKDSLKDYVAEILRSNIKNLSKLNYDECITKWLDDIKNKANIINSELMKTFTVGHAQKLLNMSIKYLWMLHSTFVLKENIKNNVKQIYEGKKNYYEKSRIEELETLNECVDCLHVPLDSFILREIDKESNPWSKIDEPDKYKENQEGCKNKANKINELPPIYWELCNWHFIKERMARC